MTRLPRTPSIIQSFRGGAAIVAGAVLLQNLLRLLSTIVLTRLLAPEAFGAIAIITSVAIFVAMISDVGFQAFTVRHPDAGEANFRHTVWTVRLVRSILLTLLMFALAGPIAELLGKPQLQRLLEVASLIFVLDGFASLSLIIAVRERQVLRLSSVELLVATSQVALSIALAVVLRSYWAIMIAMLLSGCLRIALSYLMFERPGVKLRLERRYVAELLDFARYVTGSSIITLLITQGDKLLLSRLMSIDTLGLYILAFNLATAPRVFADAYAAKVLYPAYAEAWSKAPDTLPDYFQSLRRGYSRLYTLGVGILIGASPLIIEVLYDDRYRGASLFLSILAFGSLFSLNNLAMNSLVTAVGKIEVTFKANIARLAWLAAAGPIAYLQFGALGLVVAFATLEIAALIYFWTVLRRLGYLRMKEELIMIGLGLAGGAGGFAAATAMLRWL